MTIVLGGTFDPIHNGHAYAAKTVSEKLGAKTVQLIVAGKPRLRDTPKASETERWEMTMLACDDEGLLVPNAIELNRNKRTTTADTLFRLGGEADKPVVWVIGSDAVAGLPRWNRVKEIVERASLVVLHRANTSRPDEVPGFERVEDILEVTTRSGRYYVVEREMLNISATLVRGRVRMALPISSFVHPSVREYIIERKLYRT